MTARELLAALLLVGALAWGATTLAKVLAPIYLSLEASWGPQSSE